ncbi:MAG TPA: SUMF1/EgtB/PvdO family nonheme iron enzyme [Malonomonas sp.]
MTSARHLLSLLLASALLTVLLSGCAGGPQRQQTAAGASDQTTIMSKPTRDALSAVEEKDYQQAAKRFDEILEKEEEIQDEYLYDYALALSETSRHEEAIKQLNAYIENLGRNGDNYLAALGLLSSSVQKLLLQRQETNKQQLKQSNLAQITAQLNSGWQNVLQQVASGAATLTEPLTGMELILVPGGCYQMGDNFGDGEEDERPVHQVCVDAFYLGRYEVTQRQWTAVMGYNPSQAAQGDDYPVDSISWTEANEFASTLSGGSKGYRLPTEAEWEYAARSGGKLEKFSGSDNVDDVSWHEENAAEASHPVGQKQPNGLGFYDMSGNLYEWCLDRYAADYYQRSPQQNPSGAEQGTDRTRRGGSWDSRTSYSRTSYRTERPEQEFSSSITGFRLALPAAQ